MIISSDLPTVRELDSNITEPGVAYTNFKCLLMTSNNNVNANITYTVQLNVGGTATTIRKDDGASPRNNYYTVSGNYMYITFTAPATGSVARGSNYYIDVTANNGHKTQSSRITLKQNDTYKTKKPLIWVAPINYVDAYVNCITAASTAAKVVTVKKFSLVKGARINVRFQLGSTVANATLNVNGTGAKQIWYNGARITTGYPLNKEKVYTLIYNGTFYDIVGDSSIKTAIDATDAPHGSELAYLGSDAGVINNNTTNKIALAFTPFASFFWHEKLGEYPPQDFNSTTIMG